MAKKQNRGRPASEVEFLRLLRELEGYSQIAAFAKACGKAVPNMSNYLQGKVRPGRKVLRSCLQQLHEWSVQPLLEIAPMPKLSELPGAPGIYVLYDSGGNILYLGKAANLQGEVRQTLDRKIPRSIRFGPTMNKSQPKLSTLATHLSLYSVPSDRLRHNVEAMLLRIVANHTHNTNTGKFK
jgi:hypothetical protein